MAMLALGFVVVAPSGLLYRSGLILDTVELRIGMADAGVLAAW